jgi:hypothetical protein
MGRREAAAIGRREAAAALTAAFYVAATLPAGAVDLSFLIGSPSTSGPKKAGAPAPKKEDAKAAAPAEAAPETTTPKPKTTTPPLYPKIEPFPLMAYKKGGAVTPEESIRRLESIIKNQESKRVLKKSSLSVTAELSTLAFEGNDKLNWVEKPGPIGKEQAYYLYKDEATFTYNPGTKVIDVTLQKGKSKLQQKGAAAKIVEDIRKFYLK